MSFIKNNIRLIIFIVIILILFIIFTIYINRKIDYSIEYDKDGFKVYESFNKDLDIYKFYITKDDYKYAYTFNHKYSRSKKLVESFNYYNQDDYYCLSIKVFGGDSNIICTNGTDYTDTFKDNTKDAQEVLNNNDFIIYDNNHDYLTWNGYGFTNQIDNSTYNFLTKESYSNELYYQFDNYIIVADYDQKHSFNKIYIYDNDKKKVDSFDLKVSINYDSYFMGNIGTNVYLFDTVEKTQYQMDIKKKKIRIASSKDKSYYFDKKETKINTNQLYYNKILFKNSKLIDYFYNSKGLYYTPYDTDMDVRITDVKLDNIIYEDGQSVYYIKGNDLYKYNIYSGITKLANYFEWNFDYLNKIFVFSR